MRTIETNLYTYDELSDRAKERARDWYRSGDNSFADFAADTVIDDAARIFALFGLNIRTRPVKLMSGKTRMEPDAYWDLGRDGGASVSGYYSYMTGSVQAVAKEVPATWKDENGQAHTSESNAEINRIVRELASAQRRNFYQITASLSHGRNSNQLVENIERADGKPLSDEDANEIEQLLQDAASWLHSNLTQEAEYQSSDECVEENIRANEYEFTEDGERA